MRLPGPVMDARMPILISEAAKANVGPNESNAKMQVNIM
jgi:hypothetical protein